MFFFSLCLPSANDAICDKDVGFANDVASPILCGKPGANIHYAKYAQGKKDFLSKLEIALKEAGETDYWLELLYKTEYINEACFKNLSAKCASLHIMLIASCKTAKQNLN